MIEIGVDIGGTFTDVVLLQDRRRVAYIKLPSTPSDPIVAVRHGTERILVSSGVSASQVDRFVHGSTVAINALLQRKGAVTGILTTKGFEDTLEIGRQKRSRMYDLFLEPETPIFLAPRHRRLGIAERIAADGSIVERLNENDVSVAASKLKQFGVTAIAVCYLFSFRNPIHEQRTRELIKEHFPDLYVSISSEIDPTFREYERSVITALDAYLHGAVGDYLDRLAKTLAGIGITAELQVMQSRGGITSAAAITNRPVSLLLSGLAAGVVGSKSVAASSGHSEAISLDMGGTSCDIALIKAGKPIVTSQTRVERFPIRMQMVDVNTIGAGGGSIAWIDNAGNLRVGPQSAGADPGPACYRRGGQEPTVTDASVVLGYLNPATFAGGELALDTEAAAAAIDKIAQRLDLSTIAAASGIHRIVNARMADEIRRVSIQRGYDPRVFSLLPLGGAGPLHGGALALELGIPRVVVPDAPGVLSAFGLLVADIEHDQKETFAVCANDVDPVKLREVFGRLIARGNEKMRNDGVLLVEVEIHEYADMRYIGQSYELSIEIPHNSARPIEAAVAAFHAQHQTLYGHSNARAPVEFTNLQTVHVHRHHWPSAGVRASGAAAASAAPAPIARRNVHFPASTGFVDTPIYDRRQLGAGHLIVGPAIIEQTDTTLVVYPGQSARIQADGSIILQMADLKVAEDDAA